MINCLQERTASTLATGRQITTTSPTKQRVHRRRGWRMGATALGFAALIGGSSILAGLIFVPEQVEYTYGTVKTAVTKTMADMREEAFGDLPTVTLGQSGDVEELDNCDGTFTEMTSYEGSDAPPVWAAHNGCQGDVLLPWEVGQQIQVEGSDEVYEVVDIRHTPQVWATFDDIKGLGGDFALQTCFYGEDKMKFVGLRQLE